MAHKGGNELPQRGEEQPAPHPEMPDDDTEPVHERDGK